MKKIIIILILLSIISVIGCNNEQKSVEGRGDWKEGKKSDEQIIQDLRDELKECREISERQYEVGIKLLTALNKIKEENENIQYVLDEFEFSYLTKRNAIDEIYWHTDEIENILEELEIK